MAFLVTRTKSSCICLCVSCCMETAHPTPVGPRQLRGCQCPAALVWIGLLMFHAWASGSCGSSAKASLGLSVARSKYWFRKSRLLGLIFYFYFLVPVDFLSTFLMQPSMPEPQLRQVVSRQQVTSRDLGLFWTRIPLRDPKYVELPKQCTVQTASNALSRNLWPSNAFTVNVLNGEI